MAFGDSIAVAERDIGDDGVMKLQIDEERLRIKMDPTSFGGYVLKGGIAVLQLDVDVFQIVAVALLDAEATFVR